MSSALKGPETVHFQATHYLFVEKIGPFQQTAQAAWQEAHKSFPDISTNNQVTAKFSLYKMQPQMVYRAGFALSLEPKSVPPGMRYEKFEGGAYSKFTYVGTYAKLGAITGEVLDSVKKSNVAIGSNFFIENYLNDPMKTPEDQLITEILVPTK